jgi:hypothetical protein
MKATYENNSEYSFVYIHIKSTEQEKAMKIAQVLESYRSYEMSHFDSEVVMLTALGNTTIAEMKEDYREAKKAA